MAGHGVTEAEEAAAAVAAARSGPDREQVYQHVAGAWLTNLTDVCPFPAMIPTASFSSHATGDVTLAPPVGRWGEPLHAFLVSRNPAAVGTPRDISIHTIRDN